LLVFVSCSFQTDEPIAPGERNWLSCILRKLVSRRCHISPLRGIGQATVKFFPSVAGGRSGPFKGGFEAMFDLGVTLTGPRVDGEVAAPWGAFRESRR